jgi:hypothetical protein
MHLFLDRELHSEGVVSLLVPPDTDTPTFSRHPAASEEDSRREDRRGSGISVPSTKPAISADSSNGAEEENW